jgi:hypothetical protein
MAGAGSKLIKEWPEESREAAQLVIDAYGQPQEASESQLVWHHAGPWKRIIASKAYYAHSFPAPHNDSVECVIDFRVPPEMFTPLAQFDGSVIAERTAGEASARCHDEQANFLALNLMYDIVKGTRSVGDAREYYAKEFLDYRRKKPTPYMEKLRFEPPAGGTADADVAMLTDQDLDRAAKEGQAGGSG